jgi:hypothetical protein
MVMLICLVAIPLAAVFGATLPSLVSRMFDGRFDLASVLAVDSLGGRPTSGPSHAPHDGTPALSPWKSQPAGLPLQPTSTLPSRWPASPLPPAGQTPEPARWNASAPGLAAPPGLAAAMPDHSAAPQPNLVPVAPKSPDHTSIRPVGFSGPSHDSPPASPELPQASGQFAEVERQLRELGAKYYLLETWGARGQYYRFHARMGMGSQSGCVRYFEATDPDPLQAMAKVLGQVRCWQASQ